MPSIEHSRPVRPRGRFCAWKLARVDSFLLSTAAGIFSAGITAETPAIAAPFRKPLRAISGPILALLSFITIHSSLRSKVAVVVTGDDSQALNLRPCVACVVCFLDHVLDLGLRRVERVFVDQPGLGIIEFKGSLVHLE